MDAIVNKVAQSGIITLDLSKYIPTSESMVEFDFKPFLFKEMILREKDFRAYMKEHDWNQYEGKSVAIMCSVDSVIQMWAYMLVASNLEGIAKDIFVGTRKQMSENILTQNIKTIDVEEYRDKRVVLKGCGDIHVPEVAYVTATEMLKPVVKSLMYGEPCSTVPVYKQPLKKA